jgi:hypothetical protein
VQKLAVLRIPAMTLTLANRPPTELRAVVIDALHRDLIDLPAIGARLGAVGPISGRRLLAQILHDLADREVESIFHDLVLDELARRGYRAGRRGHAGRSGCAPRHPAERLAHRHRGGR